MQLQSTPVPNILFDCFLKELKPAELKVLLVIIRQTLGWADRRAYLGRKEMDWISCSQLQQKTGCSRRAISSAIENLVGRKLIDVLDEKGSMLFAAALRKGKQRMYYRLTPALKPVDKAGKENPACATIAEDLGKKISALAQKMRITKETLQN